MEKDDQVCCPQFDTVKWDAKTHHWENKPFICESIPQLFHIPFPPMIGWKITKMWKMAEEAKKVLANKEDVLILFYDPHAFKSEIYLTVSDDVPGANNVKISGEFISKVFDGPYNDVPKFIKEMDQYLNQQNKTAKKYYIHYAYCPKCAQKYGHNYAVLFVQI